MAFHADAAWIAAVLLMSVRLGALFILAPVFGAAAVPVRVRTLLALGLSAALVAGLPQPAPVPVLAAGPLAVAMFSEALLGAAMALGLHTVFAAFQFAGKLLDVQVGFNLGSVLDPVTRAQSPLLGSALHHLALVLFFLLDGHHMLMRALAYSLHKQPLGSLPRDWGLAPFVDLFGAMFIFGLTLVAPVVVALLLMDVGLGVLSRSIPQLNVFTIGIPAKITVGLLLLAATLADMAPVMAKLFQSLFSYWQQLMA